MTPRVRLVMLLVGLAGVVVMLATALPELPGFGGHTHPYRDRAMTAAYHQSTANAVASVNFDQRAFDTFGEETILIASVMGVAALVRRLPEEQRRERRQRGHVLESTRWAATVFLPLTVLLGADVVTHGAITPGGGFQGGAIAATGIHLLYLGGRYRLLERLRPLALFEVTEAAGLAGFLAVAVTGLAVAGSVLANFLPRGQLTQLLSAGTVPALNFAVGVAVASSIILLIAGFLEQALAITGHRSDSQADDEAAS
ncbi:sodium:proton antiporter [Microlunatus elymi]|uniref:Sodium:proton antiporter n=1 Tax=Microlunatus elymi TaxID=2596828 RepID=A0A516Q226_9ACTN|nr:MnhB domain-containing protein [Microlunatus elymi]QDP97485.1 sodium:proton antiporter [Microlunatus elymi]